MVWLILRVLGLSSKWLQGGIVDYGVLWLFSIWLQGVMVDYEQSMVVFHAVVRWYG